MSEAAPQCDWNGGYMGMTAGALVETSEYRC